MFEYIQYMLDWVKNCASWAAYWWKEDNKDYFNYKKTNYYNQKNLGKHDFPFNQMGLEDYSSQEFEQFKKLYLEPEHGLFVSSNEKTISNFNIALMNSLKLKVRSFENNLISENRACCMF